MRFSITPVLKTVLLFAITVLWGRMNVCLAGDASPLKKLIDTEWQGGISFDFTDQVMRIADLETAVADHVAFSPGHDRLANLVEQKDESATLTFPSPNGPIELQLVRTNILSDRFRVMSSRHGSISYNDEENILFYRGIIKDNPGSLVALAISRNAIMGVASSNQHGDLNIIRLPDEDVHIVFSDRDIFRVPDWTCNTPDEISELMDISPSIQEDQRSTDRCVDIHFEISYRLHMLLGSNVLSTSDYILGLFNVVRTVFFNEEIDLRMSYLHIWEDPDPFYSESSSEALTAFTDYFQPGTGNEINGHLAHLLSNVGYGGRAWLSQLCGTFKTAVSSIHQIYEPLPVYSWSVKVICHETGHNFGSGHTHACIWNGNFTQIDDCGNVASPINGDGVGICFDPNNPILPENQGQIMSYCHLTSTGIDLANGFGIQPGEVIRNEVSNAIASNCLSDCEGICHRRQVAVGVCAEADVGMTTIVYQDQAGCDSLVTTTYIYQPDPPVEVIIPVCAIADTATFRETYISPGTCDSTVITRYVYAPNPASEITIPVCSEGEVGVELTTFSEAGNCDSLVEVQYVNQEVQAGFTVHPLGSGQYHFVSSISENASGQIWDFGDGAISSERHPYHQFDHPGGYVVELIAFYENDCFDTTAREVNVVVAASDVISFIDQIRILPNPNSGRFTLELAGAPTVRKMDISLINPLGAVIQEKNALYTGYWSNHFDIGAAASGVYFIRIRSGGESATLKLNITH